MTDKGIPLRTGRQGDDYLLTPAQIAQFHRDGYIVLEAVMSEADLPIAV